MRRFLFLNGIKAFEAAARTGSFAAAGLELHVSAAAVTSVLKTDVDSKIQTIVSNGTITVG